MALRIALLMLVIKFIKSCPAILFGIALTACAPPEVWKRPGTDSVEESRLRKACYKLAEGDGISSTAEVTVKFDNCMKSSGFIKVPQWQQQ